MDFPKGGIFGTFSQPISQLRNEGTELQNGTHVPRDGFATISQLRNEGGDLRNGTRVPKGCFAVTKIFAEGDRRLQNHFAAGGNFHSGCLGVAKFFRNQGPFSQGPFLGCEILHTMFSPCF